MCEYGNLGCSEDPVHRLSTAFLPTASTLRLRCFCFKDRLFEGLDPVCYVDQHCKDSRSLR